MGGWAVGGRVFRVSVRAHTAPRTSAVRVSRNREGSLPAPGHDGWGPDRCRGREGGNKQVLTGERHVGNCGRHGCHHFLPKVPGPAVVSVDVRAGETSVCGVRCGVAGHEATFAGGHTAGSPPHPPPITHNHLFLQPSSPPLLYLRPPPHPSHPLRSLPPFTHTHAGAQHPAARAGGGGGGAANACSRLSAPTHRCLWATYQSSATSQFRPSGSGRLYPKSPRCCSVARAQAHTQATQLRGWPHAHKHP
jgi:hypothetical protein